MPFAVRAGKIANGGIRRAFFLSDDRPFGDASGVAAED